MDWRWVIKKEVEKIWALVFALIVIVSISNEVVARCDECKSLACNVDTDPRHIQTSLTLS
jgi:hypothetical protein